MSYSAMRPDGIAMYPAAQATASDRLSFIRKVYGLVFCGVLFYAISAALPIVGMELGIPVLGDLGWMMARLHPMIAFLLLLGGSWLAHSVSMVRGLNLVGMFGFAGLFGLLSVNLLYFAMKFTGGLGIVFQALGLTCLVFGSLTGYVLLTQGLQLSGWVPVRRHDGADRHCVDCLGGLRILQGGRQPAEHGAFHGGCAPLLRVRSLRYLEHAASLQHGHGCSGSLGINGGFHHPVSEHPVPAPSGAGLTQRAKPVPPSSSLQSQIPGIPPRSRGFCLSATPPTRFNRGISRVDPPGGGP